ncbi:glycoside hydrolase family 9 protein [Gilvibacter sp.]|uniref:glycoside hydrolase family 9 protein n=1 Tax=Gilvibacter sp. TaxID=2729997 RepID=UPI003F49BE8F
MKILQLPFLIIFLVSHSFAQSISPFIHVDQFGYLTNAQKIAVISDPVNGYNAGEAYTPGTALQVRKSATDAVVYEASPAVWNGGAVHDQSGDRGWWFDFSSVTAPGTYYLYDPTTGARSDDFKIDDAVYNDLMKTTGRMFFYNRCNFEKEETYAGDWSDGMNFENPLQDYNARYIYDQSNASLEKDLSGGWFDAGDYNKYTTFTLTTLHNMLWAYRENPQAFSDDWNIPESGNGLPDLLDEIKWELDWLLKMNNPDGTTHIKMGSRNYSENVSSPPSANTDPRFYGPICSSASITVASVFAHASSVYAGEPGYGSYADLLLERAVSAYDYAKVLVDANALETECDDGSIVAGDADRGVEEQLSDFMSAAIYLFEATGNSSYNDYIIANINTVEPVATTFWGPYAIHLNDALLRYTQLPGNDAATSAAITDAFTLDVTNNFNGYYGFSNSDLYLANIPNWSYHWGSNNPKANYGTLNQLAIKYDIDPSNNDSYNAYIESAINYFHGVNPQNVVYLSNVGSLGATKSVNEIYHAWFAPGTPYDNAQTSEFGPAPGFLTGGPNQNFSVSTLSPPFGQPAQKSFLDFNEGANRAWEITEPAIYYQAAYLRLLANRVDSDLVLNVADPVQTALTLELVPNPAQDWLNIAGTDQPYSIKAYNMLGQNVDNLIYKQQGRWFVGNLAPGIYLLQIKHSNSGTTVVKRLVKQ